MSVAALDISGLSSGYGEALVVHDVVIDVKMGEIFALLGKNGMGKTTLLRAVMGFLPIQRGSVKLFGDDVAFTLRGERGVTTPIYLFSSIDERELAGLAADAGIDGYIAKSAGLDALVARVRQILG